MRDYLLYVQIALTAISLISCGGIIYLAIRSYINYRRSVVLYLLLKHIHAQVVMASIERNVAIAGALFGRLRIVAHHVKDEEGDTDEG